jgi:hypothetical protein
MKESPPLEVNRNELGTSDGTPLAYAAALFKGTLPAYPDAVLRIVGNGTVAGMAQERLEGTLGVPKGKVQIFPVVDPRYQDTISIAIVYTPGKAGKRTVWVGFKLDLDNQYVNVTFEVSPDGAYVEEVGAQLTVLKQTIKKATSGGRVSDIKVATKVEGMAIFDRPTSDRVNLALKAKVKAAISGNVQLPVMKKPINVEFYGAGFSKYQDGKFKPGAEFGLMLTVPFDFL